jgi:hypothetical protein
MADTLHKFRPTPVWWTEQHTSEWNHVKEALQRDWEQTKADFAVDGSRKLNQSAADTVMQAFGAEPIPAPGAKSHPNDPKEAVKDAARAREDLERASVKTAEAVTNAREDIALERVKLREKVSGIERDLASQKERANERVTEARANASETIAAAQDKAVGNIAKEHAKIEKATSKRDDALTAWREAEDEVRYGYAVRSQYPQLYVWDDKLEGKLRGEWTAIDPGMSWKLSREGIRRGWDYASTKP